MIEAACDLIRRYGAKHAAAMCGVTPEGLASSLRYHGHSITGAKADHA